MIWKTVRVVVRGNLNYCRLISGIAIGISTVLKINPISHFIGDKQYPKTEPTNAHVQFTYKKKKTEHYTIFLFSFEIWFISFPSCHSCLYFIFQLTKIIIKIKTKQTTNHVIIIDEDACQCANFLFLNFLHHRNFAPINSVHSSQN